jgi:hypothetical protein
VFRDTLKVIAKTTASVVAPLAEILHVGLSPSARAQHDRESASLAESRKDDPRGPSELQRYFGKVENKDLTQEIRPEGYFSPNVARVLLSARIELRKLDIRSPAYSVLHAKLVRELVDVATPAFTPEQIHWALGYIKNGREGTALSYMPVFGCSYLQVIFVRSSIIFKAWESLEKSPLLAGKVLGFDLYLSSHVRAQALRAQHLLNADPSSTSTLVPIARFGSADNKTTSSQFKRPLHQLEIDANGRIVACKGSDCRVFKFWANESNGIDHMSIRFLGVGPQGVGLGESMEFAAGDALDSSPVAENSTGNFSAVGSNPDKVSYFGDKRGDVPDQVIQARRILAFIGGIWKASRMQADKALLDLISIHSPLFYMQMKELCIQIQSSPPTVLKALKAQALYLLNDARCADATMVDDKQTMDPPFSALSALFAVVGPLLVQNYDWIFIKHSPSSTSSVDRFEFSKTWLSSCGAPPHLNARLYSRPTSEEATACEDAANNHFRSALDDENERRSKGTTNNYEVQSKLVYSLPFGSPLSGVTTFLNYPPLTISTEFSNQDNVVHGAINENGSPNSTFAWVAPAYHAVSQTAEGQPMERLDHSMELPSLRTNPGDLLPMLERGPHTLDIFFMNDGLGTETPCGTPASDVMDALCEETARNLFFSKEFAQAQRFIVARGEKVRTTLDKFLVENTSVNGVKVRVKDVSSSMKATTVALVGSDLANGNNDFTNKIHLVYLCHDAVGAEPAWQAAFYVTSLYHPSFEVNEAMRGMNQANLPAMDWAVSRRAPEWFRLYAFPRCLRGESVHSFDDGPFGGEYRTGTETGASLEHVEKSRVVKQWAAFGRGIHSNTSGESLETRMLRPAYKATVESWTKKLGKKEFHSFFTVSVQARFDSAKFLSRLDFWYDKLKHVGFLKFICDGVAAKLGNADFESRLYHWYDKLKHDGFLKFICDGVAAKLGNADFESRLYHWYDKLKHDGFLRFICNGVAAKLGNADFESRLYHWYDKLKHDGFLRFICNSVAAKLGNADFESRLYHWYDKLKHDGFLRFICGSVAAKLGNADFESRLYHWYDKLKHDGFLRFICNGVAAKLGNADFESRLYHWYDKLKHDGFLRFICGSVAAKLGTTIFTDNFDNLLNSWLECLGPTKFVTFIQTSASRLENEKFMSQLQYVATLIPTPSFVTLYSQSQLVFALDDDTFFAGFVHVASNLPIEKRKMFISSLRLMSSDLLKMGRNFYTNYLFWSTLLRATLFFTKGVQVFHCLNEIIWSHYIPSVISSYQTDTLVVDSVVAPTVDNEADI